MEAIIDKVSLRDYLSKQIKYANFCFLHNCFIQIVIFVLSRGVKWNSLAKTGIFVIN